MHPSSHRQSIALFAGVFLIAAGGASATAAPQRQEDPRKNGPATSDAAQPCLFVDAVKGTTLEEELNAAAASGYRVHTAWSGNQANVLLTRAAGTPGPVQYAVIDGWSGPELEEALQASGSQGFRLVPRTIIVSTTESKDGQGRIRLVMERVPGTEVRYLYSVSVETADYKSPVDDSMAGPRASPSRPTASQEWEPSPFAAGGTLVRAPLEGAVQRLAEGGFTMVDLLVQEQMTPRHRGPLSKLRIGGIPLVKRVPQLEVMLVGEKLALGTPEASASDRYRVVAGFPGAPLQAELTAAGADGYRVALTSPASDPVMVLILEKAEDTSNAPNYVVAGAGDPGSLALGYQVNRAAALGYRAVPGSVFYMPSAVVMALDRSAQYAYDYLVLTDRDELADSMTNGWALVSVSRGGSVLLLEKATTRPIDPSTAGATAGAPRPSADIRRLETFRLSTLQKKITEAAAQGYRVVRSFFSESGLAVSMEKTDASSAAIESLVVAQRKEEGMAAAMNEAAARGFRLIPGHVGLIAASIGWEPVVVMEKSGISSSAVRYHVITAAHLSPFNAEIDQAKQQGATLAGVAGALSEGWVGMGAAILESPAK